MKNNILVFVFMLLMVGVPVSPIYAQDVSLAELQALIEQLQQQIDNLKAQLNEIRGDISVTQQDIHVVKEELKILRILRMGSSGADVERLQEYLSQYSDVYPEALITGFFGPLTEAAVKRFQAKQDIVNSGSPESTGYGQLGPKTLAKVQELITSGAGTSGVIPPGLTTTPGIQNNGSGPTQITSAPSLPVTTPSGTITATPAEPAIPATPTTPPGGGATPTIPAEPATPAVPATPTVPTQPTITYIITVTAGTNGTISPGTISVIGGGSQTFTITPNTGYQIASVIVDGVNQEVVSLYSFTNVTAAHTISASFSPIQTPTPLPFSDNFNDGNADGWIAAMPLSTYSREPATWRVENQQVINTPLLTSGDNYKFLLDNYSLSNLSAEAKVLFYGSGYGGLTIWHYDLDNWVDIVGYPAGLGKDGKPLMIIQAINGLVTTTKYPYIWWPMGNGEGVWTDMKVLANGDTGVIDVYVNNQHAITYQTQVIHRDGLSGFNSGNGGGAFDDFKLDSNPF